MMHSGMGNGEAFMRAQRAAQQHAQLLNQYNAHALGLPPSAYQPTQEQPPEDTTGLRLLEEFLTKRKAEREK